MLFLFLFLLVVGTASAQDPVDVTVRELNTIPQDQIDQLNMGGTSLSLSEIDALALNDFQGQRVRFTAVVLSDPLNSGLSTPTDGFPSRVHFFVRDTTAASQGVEGMTIQLVNGGDFQTDGTLLLTVGSVIEVVANINEFSSIQVEPETITDLGFYTDFDLPDSILDPVVITTSDANRNLGGGQQVNWDNFNDLNGQYVRLEGVTVQFRDISSDRPNFLVTSDGGDTGLNFYDVSLRYRNDRDGDYDETIFNVREDDFVPPPPGSVVDLQGFVYFQQDDPFNVGTPQDAIMSIIPIADEDLVVLESPPVIMDVSAPDFVPGSESITITGVVTADPSRTITEAVLIYETSSGTGETMLQPTDVNGDEYTFEIPAAADGEFVSYYIQGTDNTGAVSVSTTQSYRVLVDGINEIEDIQRTADDQPGDPQFLGITTAMDLEVTVQSQPSVSGIISVQDDPELGPWSGIFITDDDLLTLNRGDVIRITNATISRTVLFGFNNEAALTDVTFETVSTGGDFLGYKTVTTGALADPSIAEAHEGMLLRFEDVQVTNPDPGFDEWLFATRNEDGSLQDPARADDVSEAISADVNDTLVEGGNYAFFQGPLAFAFGNYRIWPESLDDGITTDTEDEAVPGTFVLAQNYPNPFNPVTTINYQIGQSTQVRLQVFDVLGRHVATLVDGMQPIGTHTVTFDGAGLASGLYMYRLNAGGTTQVKKMMLLK